MEYTKKLIIILSIILSPLTILAEPIVPSEPEGKESGGGGEPYAQQFIDFGYKLGEFFKLNPFNFKIPFSAEDFISKVKTIDESIKDETIRDLIEFTNDKLTDKDGVEKPAVFFSAKNSVRANRGIWRNFTTTEKLIQVTMEITGLLNAPLRYENAAALVERHSSLISKIVINERADYQVPGWRAVGGDAGEFSRLTEDDIIIDGGMLGDGDPKHPAVAFFKEPLKNAEWIKNIFTGWRNGSGAAYFLVAAPNHERAVLASIQIIQEAAAAKRGDTNLTARVYLLYLTQNQSVFTGPCAAPEKLSTYERIKTCYLDLQLYTPSDDLISTILNKNAGKEKSLATVEYLVKSLGNAVESSFSKNQKSMREILREHYITDYSATLISHRGVSPLTIAAQAHGLKPSLVGSFGETPFWIKTDEIDKEDLKLYKAMQVLGENGLAYANENVHCQEFESPALVSRKKYLDLKRQRKCFHTSMGLGGLSTVFEVMEKSGFTYDEEKSKWDTHGFKP